MEIRNFKIENDLGEAPIILGYITSDQGVIAVGSLVGAFLGLAIAGIPLAISIIAAGLNDIKFASKKGDRKKLPGNDEPIGIPIGAITPPPRETVPFQSVIETQAEVTTCPQDLVFNQLKQHEGGWIMDILERPILIWGAQGSYKSYFAAYLALLRIYLKGHVVEINDPHLQLNKSKAWKTLIELGIKSYGSSFDYGVIASRIETFVSRLKNADDSKQWHSPIFDEITQYALEPEIKEVASNLLIKCLSDCRKGKEAPILISHNNTLSLLGGSSGTHRALQEGLVQLHLFSASRDGGYYPLFKGELSGLPNSRGEFVTKQISINPAWMNPEQLDSLFVLPKTADLSPLDSLGEPLKTIWIFAKKKGDWVSARDVMQQSFAVLKGVNSDKIRQYFGLLSDLGAGTLKDGKNGVVFKTN